MLVGLGLLNSWIFIGIVAFVRPYQSDRLLVSSLVMENHIGAVTPVERSYGGKSHVGSDELFVVN